jgi:hypothetical protein
MYTFTVIKFICKPLVDVLAHHNWNGGLLVLGPILLGHVVPAIVIFGRNIEEVLGEQMVTARGTPRTKISAFARFGTFASDCDGNVP